MGDGIISTLSGAISTPRITFCASAMSFAWVSTMPFSFPVVPVLNRISLTSPAAGQSPL